jgi:hypothetical protein
MKEIAYNRAQAIAYAEKWALKRNPAYYSFSGLGGDCTNFISQCIYAGCGVGFLYNFLINNKSAGPYGSAVKRSEVIPGDIIQLGRADGSYYHALFILSVSGGEIYIATHSCDAYYRPLSSYVYQNIRYIHIKGARRY